MKQRKTTRIAALALVLLMLLSYLPGAVVAAESATDIRAIEKPTGMVIVEDYDDYFGDKWVEKLELPDSVKLTLANHTVVEALVEWDTSLLDTRTPGYYFLPGNVKLPAGSTNSQNLTVEITVQVREKVNLFDNGDFEEVTRAGNGYYYATGWYLAGLGDRNAVGEGRNGSTAAMVRNTDPTVNSRGNYNSEGKNTTANVGARIAAEGAGQYYVGIYAKKGTHAAQVTLTTSFLYRYGTQTTTPSNQRPSGNKITLTQDYVASSMLVDLPADVTYAQLQFTPSKTDKTASFDDIGVYFDDAEIIPLKVALKVEPSNVAEIKSEVPSRYVAINYDKYVGDNWKEKLDLPKTVEVITDNGTVAKVEVKWNYSELDVTKYGKYVLEGTLSNEGFPNPKGLTVQQKIYVYEPENMFANPSFEEGSTNWSGGSSLVVNGTPAAAGKYALWAKCSKNAYNSYNIFYPHSSQLTAMAERVAAAGVGQYYVSGQVMDALYTGEVPHTDSLSAYIELRYKNDINASTSSLRGTTTSVTITDTGYVTTSGVFEMTGEEVWLRTDFYLRSNTKFADQWVLVDDMHMLPINVLIPKGEEPSDVEEILEQPKVRMIALNYDQYVGEKWQEQLNLPATVKVKTANGRTADVGVSWDISSLKIDKVGKYTLIGTLDSSNYPNPKELSVIQIIHVREPKNLMPNGGFESGVTNWGWGANYAINQTPAAEGKFAVGVKSSSNAYTSYNMFYPVIYTELGEKVQEAGGGQYYLSGKFRDYDYSGEVTHTDPLQMFIQLRYKDDPEAASSSWKGETNVITLTQDYQQASGVFNLSGNEVWLRMDMYMKSTTAFKDQWILADDIQLLPINVEVDTYEGTMEAVQTVIPARNIVQDYPKYIGPGYTTADLMLPEAVNVRSSLGEIIKVDVTWDYSKLDLSKKGTYKIPGVLDDMRLSNDKGLTVEQVIHVVDYKNLISNGSFDDGTNKWNYSGQLTAVSVASPKHEGDYSIEARIGTLQNYSTSTGRTWIQAFYSGSMLTVGQRIASTGAGRYYFSVWAQGGKSGDDIGLHARLLYRTMENGDASTSTQSPEITLSTSKFQQTSGLVNMPDDVYWTRFDIYFTGTIAQMRSSTLYLDNAELVPLNVEVPNMTDIIYCEDPADVYAYVGSSVEELKLPEKLEVVIKNGQRFDLPVTWDVSKLNLNAVGEQYVSGKLELGGKYSNLMGFTPDLKLTLRAKGEDLRQTIYISATGSEDNDGLSPESPKQDIKNIASYMRKGYNVRLKRGDVWYLPSSGITLKNLYATEDAPLVLGAYGDSGELPIIAYMLKIEDSAWELVDEKRNVYAADVSSLGQRNGEYVHRCFINDEPFTHIPRSNYVALDPGWYCSYGGKLYVRMPEGEGAPTNVEVTPYGSGGNRLSITDVSHLTIEYIHFKGSSAINTMMTFAAPTEYLKFQYCSITHCYYYIMVFEASDERVHYRPEVSNCFIDAMFNKEEGAKNYDKHWNVGITEGIVMRDGVEEGWIHHNHLRNMSHAFITIESLDRNGDYNTRGVFNSVIEHNLLEGGNALYARAFGISGGYNLSGTQMNRNNIWRYNRAYDMTTASHLFGDGHLIYSNLISYVHCEYNEEGVLFDGKSAQPCGFDVFTYGDHGLTNTMLVNNTFYNVSSAVGIYDKGGAVYDNLFANNLIVNWTSDAGAVFGSAGAIYDFSDGFNYVMNNGLYAPGQKDHFVVDDVIYTVEGANLEVAGYSGNIYADPLFVDVDMTLMGKEVRQDFTLSKESPMRYAGLNLNHSVFERFPMYEALKAEYKDINGVVYLAESPSIGAWSFCERIGGEVASVEKIEDIVARTGADIEQLSLPDTVTAVNDEGIDVVLLIDWLAETFDSSKDGTVTVTGQLRNGPHTELNVEGKTVTANIQLKNQLELISITSQVKGFTVLYNTSLEDTIAQLPKELSVITESGFEENIPVSWICDNYKPNVPGAYTFKCVLPLDLVTNPNKLKLEVEIQVMHEISRGTELLINPDFIDGTSANPWKMGWGNGNFRVTTDPEYLYPGEPASVIVTENGRYGSIQQNVTGQVKLMGNGLYLFRCYMRSYQPGVTIDSSYAALQVIGKTTDVYRCRAKIDIGEEWVEYYAVMNIKKVEEANEIMFHTSTGKTKDDSGKSFVISGCSLIFLGTTAAEQEATLDTVGLTWNAIRGENVETDEVTKDLTLPDKCGESSTIVWTSSNENAVSTTGKVTMGRLPQTVTLTATITTDKIVTVKKFTVTVPRNATLPVFTGSLSGEKTNVKPGEEFSVVISMKAENADKFNAYRFTMSFSSSSVEFVSVSDPAAATNVEGGMLTISGIGTEHPIADTLTVTFKAKKGGVTDVKLVKVEMDFDPNVTMENLPLMQVKDGVVTIDVEKTSKPADAPVETEKNDGTIIWIIVGVALVIAGGAVALILIKKKKQTV